MERAQLKFGTTSSRAPLRAKEDELGNLHAVVANANIHLAELVDDRVSFVSINFPDPWFKNGIKSGGYTG